jgi:hypothetical protein
MPALSDHVRRDADAASLAEINVLLGQFKRRAYETAKTSNKQTVETVGGVTVPFGYGPKVGRLTALQALKDFLPELDDDINRAKAALEAGDPA